MTKHRMRDSMKSLFRSHIDPDWNEQLEGTRAEIEDRVTKVLKLSSGSDTEQLSELIQDLHQKYQSICDQYSDLTEEIKNKVDGNQENGAASSSSSDSDDPAEKKSSQNGKSEGESAKFIVEDLKNELEIAKLEVAESNRKKEAFIEEAETTSAENQKLREKLEEMAAEREISVTEKEAAVRRTEEVERVSEELRDEKAAVDRELDTAMEVNRSLTLQLPILRDEKAALQQELGAVNGEVRRMKQQLESAEKKIAELIEENSKLSEEHQIVQYQLKKCKASLENVETKLEATETEFRLLKVAKEQEVAELEGMMDELKRDLELKGDEASSSIENVRNLEVRLRLSNQKYRVTDQLLTEEEEKSRAREAEYEKEIKCLEDRIGAVSETAASYKRMVLEIAGEVNFTMEGFESVVRKLEDKNRNHAGSILHVGDEIRVVKNWVREVNGEKRRVEEERAEEGKMREKVERLEAKAGAEEAEKAKLVAEMKQLRKKGEEMGLKLKEMKLGAAVLGEEKREAIRQLCVCVDYQRSRCEDLKDVVAKLKKASRG